jgi:uncharacterized protein (UPF0332 family)
MSLKYLEEDARVHSGVVNQFTREIVEWIYFNEGKGEWAKKMPKTRLDLFYERQIYGLTIIDRFDLRLGGE